MIDITGTKFIIAVFLSLILLWGSPNLPVAQLVGSLVILSQFALLYFYGQEYSSR